MAEVNEIVRYGAQGICRIQQIEEKSIGASRRLYYVLKPVYHEDSTIFVPVDNPALTGKMHRLLRAQAAWVGFKQTTVEFDRPERVAGETHYTLKKMIRLAESGVFPNSDYPLTLPLKAGLCLTGLSLVCFVVFIVLACSGVAFGGLTAWLFPALGLATGIVLTCHGLSNIYLSMIYSEVQNRPKYIVADKFNL